MIARILLILGLAAPAAAWAQPAQHCPWLNAGTAARILGAEVTASIHADSNWSGSCRFVAAADPDASIEIVVGKSEDHSCGPDASRLTAIGNSAVLCSAQNANGRNVQTVSGRVRDAWFHVAIVRSAKEQNRAPKASDASHSSPIQFLAEQVAGNLY